MRPLVDNYNRNRYSKNPGIDRRLSLDCTAIAALPDIDIPFQGTFVDMLSLLDIVRRVQAVAQDIGKAGRDLLKAISQLDNQSA